jgi:hypothetical protein
VAKDIISALEAYHTPDNWAFFEELRIGTGYGKDSEQRFDGWAINYHPSKRNVVRCYEVKISRSDYFSEIKNPKKRRAGLRLSNEFYFITPRHMLRIEEVPPECGLMEVDSDLSIKTIIAAPYRDTIPPTWLFIASICRRLDKDRFTNYNRNLVTDQELKMRATVFFRVLADHIKSWRDFDKGNKEIPDKIAEALKNVFYCAEDEVKKSLKVSKNFDIELIRRQIFGDFEDSD